MRKRTRIKRPAKRKYNVLFSFTEIEPEMLEKLMWHCFEQTLRLSDFVANKMGYIQFSSNRDPADIKTELVHRFPKLYKMPEKGIYDDTEILGIVIGSMSKSKIKELIDVYNDRFE